MFGGGGKPLTPVPPPAMAGGATSDAASSVSDFEAVALAEAVVMKAYTLHDTLYNTHDRPAVMKAAQAEALAAVDAAEAAVEAVGGVGADTELQARLWYLRGKAAASAADCRSSPVAEALLADAVKLDPQRVDAWNTLGECYWARGELDAARHCFVGALDHKRNAESLSHLSMLLV